MNRLIALLVNVVLAGCIAACTSNTAPGNDRSAHTAPPHEPARVATAATAIREADPMAIEPSTMTKAEYMPILGPSGSCHFSMTRVGRPVFATDQETGVIRINGKLVTLGHRDYGSDPAMAMRADGIEVRVTLLDNDGKRAPAEMTEAELVFSLDAGRTVGYVGFYVC